MSDSLPIIGIDLGTTHSLVGVVDAGFPILLADSGGDRLLPSVVHYQPDGSAPLTGQPAARMRARHPSRTIGSVKRLMGRRFDELAPDDTADLGYRVVASPSGRAAIDPGAGDNRQISPEEVSSEILRALKDRAEEALELAPGSLTRAVITVPAYFNDGQRNATKRAGELAGLTVERILNEPTAAALAYGLDKLDERSRVAVYDLGGGTFDLSILELRDGVFQVIATDGDTRLGGDDLDAALADWLREKMDLPDPLDAIQQTTLLAESRRAKEALSTVASVTVSLPFFDGPRSYSTEVSREEFEAIARPWIDRTRAHCLRALGAAGCLAVSDPTLFDRRSNPVSSEITGIDRVILVGGSTRIPLVRQIVAEIFGREPDVSQHPDEAVALGAAIQAGILCGRVRQVLLLDVTPLSLGIETFGGLMNVIIPRNTTIPAKAGEMFTNAIADQASMLVRVLQGEREMARDNWELGRITLDFPPGPKGSARVGVQFSIDADGILTVLARDTATQTDRVLEIRDSAVDVDDARVEEMIAESVDHAFADMNERVWTEARLKSEELLPAVELALAQAGDALTPEEMAAIKSAATAVRELLADPGLPAQRLRMANQSLDDATETLAAILVERALERALGAGLGA
ncbi:MAG: Hsp70 family protein [Verrucomicrobiales bacterium]|nr:Hsp70 family protein [Verrucomicrobiales bacterium]